MKRVVGVSVLVASTCLVAGCGSPAPRLHGLSSPPRWVDRIVAREVKHFHGRHITGGFDHLPKTGVDEVQVFGSFLFSTCPIGAYCPAGTWQRGTTLRLVLSASTHRLLSAKLTPEINPTQAPAIARRSNRLFAIFPSTPGHRDCSIPEGGAHLAGTPGLPARCTTEFTAYRPPRGVIHIRFNERWYMDGHLHVAAWIVGIRLRDGHVLPVYDIVGEPPQEWK